MDLADRADGPGLHELHHAAVVVVGVDLRAHLRDELLLPGDLGHDAGLVHRVRERLLAVAVLAQLHGHDGRRGVGMVRRADHHRVDLAVHLVQHLAEVLVPLGRRELLKCLGRVGVIDVAQGHEVFTGHALDIVAPASGDADAGDIQLLMGRHTTYRPWV